jgi:hypothetical protein
VRVSKDLRQSIIIAFFALTLLQSPLMLSTSLFAATNVTPPASVQETNFVVVKDSMRTTQPIRSPVKRKAGFLAGAGLAILTLLGLGAALALVRSFKR